MQVSFKNPDLQAKVNRWVEETGRAPDELVEEAMAGYFEELVQTRKMLDSRFDELRTGGVKPVDGDAFFEDLRCREEELLKKRSQ